MQAGKGETQRGHGFGTAPVYLAAISTILGAILFLRFGYAVAHTGILGALIIVLIGHMITIPTGMAVAEIATNLKVEGGGEYYIISRSFGTTVGGTIGISLYFSQAISVAFYMIAFSEAFRPLFPLVQSTFGFTPDARLVGVPATIILLALIFYKGANVGVKLLWAVVGLLVISLLMFFLGSPIQSSDSLDLLSRVKDHDDFFTVFAIVFPAFTGMTAGVGLSGDLKNPRRSIPLGTLLGTLTGMVVYVLVVIKLGTSVSPEDLAGDQFIMSRIALWGPIIPIGLGAATISSAIGSILVAPRTLQALAGDRVFPSDRINKYLTLGRGKTNEPVNATLVTSVIALSFVAMGSVDFVAQIISMFFMVTYGTLCSISFLEHFSGDPSYRPTFKSKWYLSLIGAIVCFWMMYQMQPVYAVLAILAMALIYLGLAKSRQGERDLSAVLQGVLFQLTRKLQVLIQKKGTSQSMSNWRPSVVAISTNTITRLAPFDMLRWLSYHYGFGSFIHFIKGPLTQQTHLQARELLTRMVKQVQSSRAAIYVDTIVSPSFRTAVAQIVQIPGISGLENNTLMFEFSEGEVNELEDIIDSCTFAAIASFNILILRSSERHFGYRKSIHIWLTPGDYQNANLMIILAYILAGHPEWDNSEIQLFTAFHEADMNSEVERLNRMITQGRIPISQKNVIPVPLQESAPFDSLVCERSSEADLVITGFSYRKMQQDSGKFLKGFDSIKDILFVRAGERILIADELPET
ncbi:MAG: amino acid permease [Candidatus Glassbacteria bacterium]